MIIDNLKYSFNRAPKSGSIYVFLTKMKTCGFKDQDELKPHVLGGTDNSFQEISDYFVKEFR